MHHKFLVTFEYGSISVRATGPQDARIRALNVLRRYPERVVAHGDIVSIERA